MKTTIRERIEIDVELAVTERYSAAAQSAEPSLCCAVRYEPQYLNVLPPELIERDYGCGDPSRYVREGEVVLDLGSGGGKICYIASQIVGPRGRVIGVDMNDEMLALARQYQREIGERIGWQNVEFHKGRIQDLALDLDEFDRILRQHPITTAAGWLAAQRNADTLRQQSPMVANDVVDVVLSNCVLNLVQPRDRQELFAEVLRVLRPGGRAVISDIVSSAPVPARLRSDPQLWSGCISGAFEESAFLEAFQAAGFQGMQIVERQLSPWTVREGIEFRSVTVQAYKPVTASLDAPSGEVIYRGPWQRVTDDEGNEFKRGQRTRVPAATLARLTAEPFAEQLVAVADSPQGDQGLTLMPISGQNGCEPGKCC